jgi:hypothetical protein
LSSIELAELAVEGAKREMTGFASHLDHQTVREAQPRLLSILYEGSGDCVRVLKRQILVIEEHLDCGRDVGLTSLVHGGEDPRGLG